MKKYILGLSIIIGSAIIASAIVCSAESCKVDLTGIADVSQIVIAVGAIGSIMFAVATIKESDWSLAMAHVPSLAIRPGWIFTYRTLEGGRQIQSETGEPLEKSWPGETCQMTIQFSCENLGRGAAFNIKKPLIEGAAYKAHVSTPLYMTPRTIEDEAFRFSAVIEKSFDEWVANGNAKIPVRVEVRYTNDQKNVQCCSWWKADVLPFDVSGSTLNLRELRVLSRDAGVDYSPIKRS